MENTNSERENIILPAEPFRGIKSFRYADREIFAAREWEKEQLLNLVSLYRASLIYGQSGIGKSSLINAGLIPELENYNFRGEIIRVSPNRDGTFIVYKIPASDKDRAYLPSLFDELLEEEHKQEISVSFEKFKEIINSQLYTLGGEEREGDEESAIPVFIFDQFEELITLFEERIYKTASEIELTLTERKAIQSELIDFFRDIYYNSSLRIKFLFVFREDYLAKLSKLLRAIPDLRDHTLRIKAVSKDDIYGIIKRPFEKDRANEITRTR